MKLKIRHFPGLHGVGIAKHCYSSTMYGWKQRYSSSIGKGSRRKEWEVLSDYTLAIISPYAGKHSRKLVFVQKTSSTFHKIVSTEFPLYGL